MKGGGESTDVAIVGAGIIGIAVAYYLATRHGLTDLVLLDAGEPMALTSAASGENYRNWWPHPVMTEFTDHAIDLLEDIARHSGNRVNLTRRGYALATRRSAPEDLLADLHRGYGAAASGEVRLHTRLASGTYRPATGADWEMAPGGVDVLMDPALIRTHLPGLAPDVATIVHIRRAGDLSGQQLGQFMLDAIRAKGGRVRRATLKSIGGTAPFLLRLQDGEGAATLRADRLVNAAGPCFGEVAAMLGEALPVSCVFQQKIAFEDREAAIPRDLPFTIDLDGQQLDWTADERDILASEPTSALLLRPMPGGVHRRPEGGNGGRWIKLGWAYNATPSDPRAEAPVDANFPDVVIRAAARLSPALRTYLGRLPRGARHYGGYYTMTPENWPLIGPMRTAGAFMAGALSGFGTMAATATGALCAATIAGAERPAYAGPLTLARYDDPVLMAGLHRASSKGVL